MKEINSDRDSYIKSYDLIQASYKMNLNEAKIMSILLSTVKYNDNDIFNTQISLNQFKFMYENRNTVRLKKIITNLRTKYFKIENEEEYTEINIFQKITLHKKSNILEFKFSEDLKEFVINLNKYKPFKLFYVLKLNSEYSIRIYEMLKQKEKLRIFEIDLNKLCEILQVPKSYLEFKNFKSRVLTPVMEDLEKNTDIKFNYEVLKNGKERKIKFDIFTNHLNSITNFDNFISFIRENFINVPLVYYPHTKGDIQVSEKGRLYLSNSRKEITNEQSQKLWNWIFENQDKLKVDISLIS